MAQPSAAHRFGVRLPRPVGNVARSALVRARHHGLQPKDVVLASYPKSGNTWMRFVLAGALSGREVDFDRVADFSPPLGQHRKATEILPSGGRLVKSHEWPGFVGPDKAHPRVLWLVRDGRDVGVSYWHALRRKGRMDDDLDTFFESYTGGSFAQFGSWQDHTRRWCDYAKTRPDDVMFVRYEDLLADSLGTLTAINDTFGLGLSEEQLSESLEANTPEAMRGKETGSRVLAGRSTSAEPFVRAATSGSWHDVLDPAAIARFEAVAGDELLELGYSLSAATLPPDSTPTST